MQIMTQLWHRSPTKSEPVGLSDAYAHLLFFEMRQEQNQAVMQVNSTTRIYRGRGCGRSCRGRAASMAKTATTMRVKDKDRTTTLQTNQNAKCAARWDMLL